MMGCSFYSLNQNKENSIAKLKKIQETPIANNAIGVFLCLNDGIFVGNLATFV